MEQKLTCFYRVDILYLKRMKNIFKFLIIHFLNLLSHLVVCGIWLVGNICKLNKKLIKRIHVLTLLTCASLDAFGLLTASAALHFPLFSSFAKLQLWRSIE